MIFKNPPGISTGEYGDDNCSDERLWAAAELWRTTGEAAYNDYFVKHYPDFRAAPGQRPAGRLEGSGAHGAVDLCARTRERARMPKRWRTFASARRRRRETIVERTRKNPYRVSLLTKDYVWGSNGVVANYGMELLVANARSRPIPALWKLRRTIFITCWDAIHFRFPG